MANSTIQRHHTTQKYVCRGNERSHTSIILLICVALLLAPAKANGINSMRNEKKTNLILDETENRN